MPGRTFVSATGYRYGYQGSEKDDEVKGSGLSYTTENRILDPRLGRWLSIDPLSSYFPGMSPYNSMDNNPIVYNDILGLAVDVKAIKEKDGKTYDKIKTDWQNQAGLIITEEKNDKGELLLKYEVNSSATGYSKRAQKLLIKAIDSKKTVHFKSIADAPDAKKGDGSHWDRADNIFIDSKQIDDLMSGLKGGVNSNSLGFGLVSFHELYHWQSGFLDPEGDLDYEGYTDPNRNPGKVVSYINVIRRQLGADYGQRTAYKLEIRNAKGSLITTYIPLDKATKKYILKHKYAPEGGKYYEKKAIPQKKGSDL